MVKCLCRVSGERGASYRAAMLMVLSRGVKCSMGVRCNVSNVGVYVVYKCGLRVLDGEYVYRVYE